MPNTRGWWGEVPATAPPQGGVLGLKERNISDWWHPADDSQERLDGSGKDCTRSEWLVTQPTTLQRRHPIFTTKSTKRKQPTGPQRGGVKDGFNWMDHMEVTGTNTDNEKSLRICGCGWRKVTTFRGLQIHQGRMRCKGKIQQQPCTSMADQTRGTKESARSLGSTCLETFSTRRVKTGLA